MTDKKVELRDEQMDGVMGGISYNTFDKTIGKNGGPRDYKYDDLAAVQAWLGNHMSEACKGRSIDEREEYLLNGLIAAGLIHK